MWCGLGVGQVDFLKSYCTFCYRLRNFHQQRAPALCAVRTTHPGEPIPPTLRFSEADSPQIGRLHLAQALIFHSNHGGVDFGSPSFPFRVPGKFLTMCNFLFVHVFCFSHVLESGI